MFFNLRVVSRSRAELSAPVDAVLKLRSIAGLLCLVNLALSVLKPSESSVQTTPVPGYHCDINGLISGIYCPARDCLNC